MKTLRLVSNGKIIRLPDFQAVALIERGLAKPVPKEVWKKSRTKEKKE